LELLGWLRELRQQIFGMAQDFLGPKYLSSLSEAMLEVLDAPNPELFAAEHPDSGETDPTIHRVLDTMAEAGEIS